MDIGEATNENIVLVFLDWEKAFDKIKHEQLLEALKRIGITDKFIRIFKHFYEHPQFRVRAFNKTSTNKTQNTGIRQGCTLSPYLFLIIMTVFFYDTNLEVVKHTYN